MPYLVRPLKGKSPITRVKRIIPIAHISMDGDSFEIWLERTSGDIYLNDPTLIYSKFILVRLPAMPKSTSFMIVEPYLEIMIFSNFKSLCMSLFLWQ